MSDPVLFTVSLGGGRTAQTYFPVQLLQGVWEQFETQVNIFNDVISVPGHFLASLDEGAQKYILHLYEQKTGKEPLFVRDGAHVARYYVGPKDKFDPACIIPQKQGVPDIFMPSGPAMTGNDDVSSPAADAMGADEVERKPAKIPRPPNAYILYRKDHHSQVKEMYPGIHNNEISVILGEKWNNEDPQVRKKYARMATEVKLKLLEKYPDYRYQPRKVGEKKRRNRKNNNKSPAGVNGTLPTGRVLNVPVGSNNLATMQGNEQQFTDGVSHASPAGMTASPQPEVNDELVLDWAEAVKWLSTGEPDQGQNFLLFPPAQI